LSQQTDQRERDFAFAQIAQNRFAEFCSVRGEIKQIVNQLESYAEIQPVIGERAPLLFVRPAQNPPNSAARAEQVAGLAADDLQVLIFSDAHIPDERQLD